MQLGLFLEAEVGLAVEAEQVAGAGLAALAGLAVGGGLDVGAGLADGAVEAVLA